MEYKVEEISPVERKIQVSVPAEEATSAILATTALYRRDADVKGFRKGKVPTDMVEARYRKQIFDEATTDLINLHINQILTELKLVPMSGLKVDAGQIVKGEDFSYSVSFEVAPRLDLPEYKGRKIEQESVEVKDDEVQAVVERIRESLAEVAEVEEPREAKDGDVVTVSFAALAGGEFEGLKADNFQLELGKGQALEGFEQLIIGLKPDEQRTGMISFPADFINEKLAGKSTEVRVHLHSIKEKRLPEMTDELAKKAGNFESVDKMREAITESYTKSRTQLNKSVAQNKLIDQLMEGMEIPLPPSLVEKNIGYMVSERRERLERRGKSLESLGKSMEELQAEFKPEAEKMARTQVFLLAVATAEGLTVDPQEVEAVIRQAAAQSGQEYENLREYHERTGLIHDIKDRILADKASELIYETAEVTEVPPAQDAGGAEASA
ncbi:trigger factor [Desulfocurvibacter africanus PCS]|uniref:Trigger factor n=1 Tax=Desulfocurvibacter africanus PCS TaxID=1262666 RepID=M5PXM9_DESAF|nr:trigger factor [Desulfocurvibacter africanus]EMG39052.1 trigger factor [Desulfocurvibacter africanus PCS]